MKQTTEQPSANGFDPHYFRETRPRWSGVGDADCRLAWQTDPAAAGPGTPLAHLARIGLDLPAFPAEFPWKFYARRHPQAGAHRWRALEHFVRHGFAADFPLPNGPWATELLLSLARAYAVEPGGDRLAIKAFELADAQAGLAPDALQHLADSYLREKLWSAARDTYGRVLGTDAATAWTVHNCAQARMELGDWAGALQTIAGADAAMRADPAWAASVHALLHGSFDAAIESGRSLYAQARFGDGDEAVQAGVARTLHQLAQVLPARPASQARTHLLVIANQDDAVTLRYRVEAKAVLAQAIGAPCTIRFIHQVSEILDDLRQARAVIFVEIAATVDLLKILVQARAEGLPIFFDANGPIFDPAVTPPPIETFGGLITPAQHDELRLHAALCRSLASLCDGGIAAAAGTAAALAGLVRDGRCCLVANGMDTRPFAAADARLPNAFLFLRSHRFMRLTAAPQTIGAVILALLERENIGLVLSGYVKLAAAFGQFDDRIVELGPSADPASYDRALAGAVLNLAPEAGADDDGVVQVSWLEAAVHGVPTAMSQASASRIGLVDTGACLVAELPALLQGITEALRTSSLVGIGMTARRHLAAAHATDIISRHLAQALAVRSDGTAA